MGSSLQAQQRHHKLQQLQERQEELAKAVARLSRTDDGSVLFKLLGEVYDGALFTVDPIQTAYNLGGRDLYRFLQSLSEKGKGD